ncbi:serine hydrolase [Pedobacter sp. SYP-B3415]|uniref:serine hydrolase domain-containing protein n=1 Tax=Pedobacter sp. SYP-B3415 TaxID=2496641 RepID=UPI00101C8827|nr:serine hydrolase domain-containing protein [Pedobacter sp. SYP-B3415]
MKKVIILFILWAGISKAQVHTHSGKQIGISLLEIKVRKALDSLKIPGMSLAIINKGKVVYANGFGFADLKSNKAVTAHTYFEAASLSKPVFSFYVQKLAREGVIDLDKPLFGYLPAADIADERYKKLTARMVLSHTTGLPNWREGNKMQLAFDPGTAFSYSGEGFMYLAKVIAHLRKRSLGNLDEDFQREVAIPLHLKNFHFVLTAKTKGNLAAGYQDGLTVFDERDRQSFDAAGGMFANVMNYSDFLVGVMKQRAAYPALFTAIIDLKAGDPVKQFFKVDSWTAGLAVIRMNGAAMFWHGGNNLGYTSSFMIDPDKQFGYVFFTNADQANAMKQTIENILFK